MKRLTAITVTIAAMMILMLLCAAGVYASSTSNVDWTTAKSISANSDVSGNVTEGYQNDQNVYKVLLNENGVLTIDFSNPQQASSDAYWTVSLANNNYEVLLGEDIHGNKTHTETTKMGLAAGTYYIVVTSSSRYSVESTDTYTLKAAFEASEYWEREPNEAPVSATMIDTNKDYFGTTKDGNEYELDYYSFTLPKAGYISLNVKYPLQPSKEDYWDAYLYDGEYEKLTSWGLNGSISDNHLTKVGLPAGTYYVRIRSDGRYSVDSTDVYTLNVNYTSSDLWEREFNDAFNSSTPIELKKVYNGSINRGDDYDYYAFDISETDDYSIKINTKKQESTGSLWRMFLYDAEYNEVKEVDIKGSDDTTEMVERLHTGRYYVQVKSYSQYSSWCDDPYELTVNRYVHISNVEDGYIMGIKQRYRWSGLPITPSPVVIYYDNTLIEGVDYTVSYDSNTDIGTASVTVTGINAYTGTLVEYYSIIPKGTEITKLIRLKKAFKVKWKKQTEQTDGYQLQYSLKKSMKSSKKVTIWSNTKAAKKIQKLKRRKKYFVRIRTFKYVDGDPIYSTWSAVKSVKTK